MSAQQAPPCSVSSVRARFQRLSSSLSYAGAAQPLGIALRRFLGIAVDGGHAQRVVHQHGRVRQAGPFQARASTGRSSAAPAAPPAPAAWPPTWPVRPRARRLSRADRWPPRRPRPTPISSSVAHGGQAHAYSMPQAIPSPASALMPSRRSSQLGMCRGHRGVGTMWRDRSGADKRFVIHFNSPSFRRQPRTARRTTGRDG